MTPPKDESRSQFEGFCARELKHSFSFRDFSREPKFGVYEAHGVEELWSIWQASRRAFAEELVNKCQAAKLPELPSHLQPATDMRLSFNDGVECVIDLIRKRGESRQPIIQT